MLLLASFGWVHYISGMSVIRPFKRQDSYAAIPWLVAFMVMLATLCLGFALNVQVLTESMRGQHEGHVTLYWSASSSAGEQEKMFALLASHPAIENWQHVPREHVMRLLEPWLGGENMSLNVPLPIVVDVVVRDGADVAALHAELKEMVPQFSLVEHQAWLSEFIQLLNLLRYVALGLVGFIAIVGAMVVMKATRTELSLHFDTVDLLRYLGANKGYIAKQFRYSALLMSLRGVLAGGVACAAGLWFLNQLPMAEDVVFGALLHVGEGHGYLLAAVMLGWVLFMSWLAGHAVMRRMRLCA